MTRHFFFLTAVYKLVVAVKKNENHNRNPFSIPLPFVVQGDLCAFLKRKGALKPVVAVKFALDIARF